MCKLGRELRGAREAWTVGLNIGPACTHSPQEERRHRERQKKVVSSREVWGMGGSCSRVSAARAETPQLDSAPQGQSAVQPSADGEAAVAEAREAAAREAEAQKWAAKDTEALPTEEAPQAVAEDERASAVAGALPTVPQMAVEDDCAKVITTLRTELELLKKDKEQNKDRIQVMTRER